MSSCTAITCSDADKLLNAQNYAFFALEVMANPDSGKPPGHSCSAALENRSPRNVLLGGLGEPEDLMARANNNPGHLDQYHDMLRRQINRHSRAPSTLRTLSRKSTRAPSPTKPSSGLPSARITSPPRPASGPVTLKPVTSSKPPHTTGNGAIPMATTVPPVSVSSPSGASFSMAYSTAPAILKDSDGDPMIPIIPIPIPIVMVVPMAPMILPGLRLVG